MAKNKTGDEKSYLVKLTSYEVDDSGQNRAPLKLAKRIIPADYCTVEPSGALTFWVRNADESRSALVIGYGAGVWSSVELQP